MTAADIRTMISWTISLTFIFITVTNNEYVFEEHILQYPSQRD